MSETRVGQPPGSPSPAPTAGRVARRVVLQGHVQGLGVRPAIYRLASQIGLAGQVSNTGDGVEIIIEGDAAAVAAFEERLAGSLPAAAVVESRSRQVLEPRDRPAFGIVCEPSGGPLAVRLPRDIAVCGDCLGELFSVNDRRHRYPFTSCTRCGPRYSIVRAMPYERSETAMAEFPFCPECQSEYRSPSSRRFHAQTNACPACGPRVWVVDESGHSPGADDAAVRFAVGALRDGRIVAVKGLGGYQLLVDATDHAAVARLRDRKHRPSKPLAVLVASLAEARELAVVNNVEADVLLSPANPILLAAVKRPTRLASNVHPGLNDVGLLLPTTPLHAILASELGRPLICTSGNDDGDPLVYRSADAEAELRGTADLWLHHDRPIERPIDDSVVRVIAGRPVTIRLARGLAPLPLEIPAGRHILALGGHLKSAVAWSNGRQAVLGPHLGDLEGLASRARYIEQLDAWQSLYRFQPAIVVHDQHPDYFTTRFACDEREAAGRFDGAAAIGVQHHHAHVVAGMVEHGWLDRTVLGVAWDGTGFGPDSTIWGGEFLVCNATEFTRLARLLPFPLPGGEQAIRQPWRTACSIAAAAEMDSVELIGGDGRPTPLAVDRLRGLLVRPQHLLATSSSGRLFDAVASLLLGVHQVAYDAQAAMWLEAAADPAMTDPAAAGWYQMPLTPGDPGALDWRPLVRGLLIDRQRQVDVAVLAARFHRTLARGIARVCGWRPELPVVLVGGTFQNRLLTEMVVAELTALGRQVGTPGLIPPSDGGLAVGQLAIAARRGVTH